MGMPAVVIGFQVLPPSSEISGIKALWLLANCQRRNNVVGVPAGALGATGAAKIVAAFGTFWLTPPTTGPVNPCDIHDSRWLDASVPEPNWEVYRVPASEGSMAA